MLNAEAVKIQQLEELCKKMLEELKEWEAEMERGTFNTKVLIKECEAILNA